MPSWWDKSGRDIKSSQMPNLIIRIITITIYRNINHRVKNKVIFVNSDSSVTAWLYYPGKVTWSSFIQVLSAIK